MAESARWTVTTWNLQGSKRTDLDRVHAVVAERAPDVLLAQEIRRPQAAAVAERLGMHHHWVFKHHPFAPLLPSRAEGAAILTGHDLTDVGSDVVSDERSRRHWKRRIVVWGTVRRADGASFRVFNAHLSPHDLRAERLIEADRVAAIAERLGPTPPVLLGGDLNDHGEAETLDRLPGVEHVPSPPTNPASAPHNVLDHVLLPPSAIDVELEVPPGGDSWRHVTDHLPVTVRFSMPGRP